MILILSLVYFIHSIITLECPTKNKVDYGIPGTQSNDCIKKDVVETLVVAHFARVHQSLIQNMTKRMMQIRNVLSHCLKDTILIIIIIYNFIKIVNHVKAKEMIIIIIVLNVKMTII